MRETKPEVRVGINSMFQSNIDTIREYTQLIQEENEEEDEEAGEQPVEAPGSAVVQE